jgi:hypothetical protein
MQMVSIWNEIIKQKDISGSVRDAVSLRPAYRSRLSRGWGEADQTMVLGAHHWAGRLWRLQLTTRISYRNRKVSIPPLSSLSWLNFFIQNRNSLWRVKELALPPILHGVFLGTMNHVIPTTKNRPGDFMHQIISSTASCTNFFRIL